MLETRRVFNVGNPMSEVVTDVSFLQMLSSALNVRLRGLKLVLMTQGILKKTPRQSNLLHNLYIAIVQQIKFCYT